MPNVTLINNPVKKIGLKMKLKWDISLYWDQEVHSAIKIKGSKYKNALLKMSCLVLYQIKSNKVPSIAQSDVKMWRLNCNATAIVMRLKVMPMKIGW